MEGTLVYFWPKSIAMITCSSTRESSTPLLLSGRTIYQRAQREQSIFLQSPDEAINGVHMAMPNRLGKTVMTEHCCSALRSLIYLIVILSEKYLCKQRLLQAATSNQTFVMLYIQQKCRTFAGITSLEVIISSLPLFTIHKAPAVPLSEFLI